VSVLVLVFGGIVSDGDGKGSFGSFGYSDDNDTSALVDKNMSEESSRPNKDETREEEGGGFELLVT
jgi:hypothetical protein